MKSRFMIPMKRAVSVASAGAAPIKGDVSSTEEPDLHPGFSASGQDVWLPRAPFAGTGFVLSAVGARCGKVFLASGRWGVVANTAVLLPRKGNHAKYLWYVLNREDWWQKGGTAQPYVRVEESLAQAVYLPSFEEQQRLADFLDRETQRIDEALSSIENLQGLTKQRLEAQIVEEIARIAGLAPRVPLKRIVDPARPLTYGIVQAGDDVPGGVPYIRPMDMVEHAGVPDPTALRTTSPEIAQAYKRSTLQAGDVVVSIGPSFGKTMVVPQDLAGANLTQGTARVAPAKGFLAEYVQWSLRAPQAIAHWETAVGGATFRALNLEPLGQTPVFMATEADQEAMIQALRVTQREDARLLEITSMLVNLLNERRQALITAAATGQLDVEAVA